MLHANVMPFYERYLSTCRFGHLQGSWSQCGSEKITLCFCFKIFIDHQQSYIRFPDSFVGKKKIKISNENKNSWEEAVSVKAD